MSNKGIRVIPIFGGAYEATEDGNIYSLKRKTRKALIGKVTKAGYKMVVITIANKKHYRNVHRIIAAVFLPNPNNYREVNHKDGNKLNNSVDNLEWVTTRQNQLHAITSGLRPTLKLDFVKAQEIRKLYATRKYTQVQIAELFGVKKTQIGYIIQNKRWKTED